MKKLAIITAVLLSTFLMSCSVQGDDLDIPEEYNATVENVEYSTLDYQIAELINAYRISEGLTPLNILNAIVFGVMYVVILFAVFYSHQFFGESGLYYSALIAGLADTDAITISMAKFSLDNTKLELAASVIITATISNMLVKLGITIFKGSKATGKLVALAFGSVILIGIIYILINRG